MSESPTRPTSESLPEAANLADSAAAIARDVEAVGRIGSVPMLLKLLCEHTGMGFAAVARVTEGTWTACAVEDRISFGLRPGGQLKVETTLCREARAMCQPIVIDHASQDPVYAQHHTPRLYKIESYISVPIVRPDGQYFGNLCAIDPHPAHVSDPKTVKMFTTFAEMIALELSNSDAHDRALLEVQAQRSTAALREQFIAVLSHDLRNPLAAIDAAAQVLSKRPSEPDRKLAARIRSSTHRMAGLIDNVMDFARVRLGTGLGLDIRTAESLQASLSAVVDEMRDAHPERAIEETIQIDVPVACDPARLQQLLSNLLGNAVHHGAADQPVEVDIAVVDDSLQITVCNGGACIPEAHMQKIFEPYWRPAESKPGRGLGLGLYICKQIVEAHGGTLMARSTEDGETRFTARIPVRPLVALPAGEAGQGA